MSFGLVGTPCSGGEPPPHLPRHLLFRVLAYRLQADQLGDLDAESQRLLDRSGSPEDAGQRAVDLGRRTASLRPGTVLGREWNGQMHRVAVLADGFAWNGKTYPSLSKVAFAITGTRWNGPKFFGLRDKPSKRILTMKAGSAKSVRCAIYTRVSTDQGLEQDFNSLDAQYDASQAYIRSQAHAGWTLLRAKYDDGGFSGGNTDRPALQRLLEDVRAGKIDVIVVYKVDRLTRSLADFAKLVELFDQHNVSFVSVTQQFNTTTSMGRLTLNVLLSFAQFEREVTSERIRDKIAASKRKGLWVGGMAPLGYDTKDRKITVNEAEAERVRTIFRSYLKLGSLNLLMADLRKRGIVTKVRTLKTGETVGGIPFTRGPLAHLLRNRFYIGEVAFKGEVLTGEQPAIVDRDLFDAVQAKLTEQVNNHKTTRMKSEALLIGRIFDDRGNRMSPSHARKRRHQVPVLSVVRPAPGPRRNAPDRYAACRQPTSRRWSSRSVREHLKLSAPIDDRSLINTHVARVEVQPEQLVIQLAQTQKTNRQTSATATTSFNVPWHKTPSTRRREMLLPAGMPRRNTPVRYAPRPARLLVASIARGRRWLNELIADAKANVESIAKRERCSVRQVNMTISLAFLAPALVKAAIEGRLPRGMGVTRLRDAPIEWSRQHAMLGLTD